MNVITAKRCKRGRFGTATFAIFVIGSLGLIANGIGMCLIVNVVLGVPRSVDRRPMARRVVARANVFMSVETYFIVLFMRKFSHCPSTTGANKMLK